MFFAQAASRFAHVRDDQKRDDIFLHVCPSLPEPAKSQDQGRSGTRALGFHMESVFTGAYDEIRPGAFCTRANLNKIFWHLQKPGEQSRQIGNNLLVE
jgi:hypothetical protein